jgi:anti-sigma B factor antagonist
MNAGSDAVGLGADVRRAAAPERAGSDSPGRRTPQAECRVPLSISVIEGHEETAVVPAGDLSFATADALRQTVHELRRHDVEHVVVDLRQVDFLDSAGLGVLIGLRNSARRGHRSLTLVAGSPATQRIFGLTATHGLFDWRDATAKTDAPIRQESIPPAPLPASGS